MAGFLRAFIGDGDGYRLLGFAVVCLDELGCSGFEPGFFLAGENHAVMALDEAAEVAGGELEPAAAEPVFRGEDGEGAGVEAGKPAGAGAVDGPGDELAGGWLRSCDRPSSLD